MKGFGCTYLLNRAGITAIFIPRPLILVAHTYLRQINQRSTSTIKMEREEFGEGK